MKNFYVDINSIIDARAGVVNRMNPEVHADLVKNGYHLRKGDFFEGIDPVEFRRIYNASEMETLEAGMMTNIFHFLYPQVVDMMKEFIADERNKRDRPMLEVNVFPYDYTEDEKAFLGGIVHGYMRGIVGVKIINTDIKEMNPVFCNERYSMMVTYDYDRYINAHSEELIRNPVPTLILIGPMVYFNTDPDKDEETIDQLNQGINSLAILEAHIAPRICLKFINVEVFSIVYPDDRVLHYDKVDTKPARSIEDLERVLKEQAQKEKRIPEA